MSLINQMLQDLDRRHAGAAVAGVPPLQGTAAAVSQTVGRNYLLPSLLLLSALLATTTAWLALERHGSGAEAALETEPARPARAATQNPPSRIAAATAAADTQDTGATGQIADQSGQPAPSGHTADTASPHSATDKARKATARDATPVATAPAPDYRRSVPRDSGPVPAAPRIAKKEIPLSDTQMAEAHYQRALQQMQQGHSHEAIALMQQALDLHTAHHEVRLTLAALLLQQGRTAAASSLLEQGLALAPLHGGFAQMYARILADGQQLGAALAVLERAQPGIDTDPHYHALMAALYQKAGDNVRAIERYQALVSASPGQAAWWLGLAISHDALGDRDKALAAFEQARASGGLQAEIMQYIDTRIRQLGPAY